MCVTLVGTIVYKVLSERPQPVAPDMANAGSSSGRAGESVSGTGAAPDISRMTPQERFDRLFNRIMQAAERGDSTEVERFTPMALGAYGQLGSFDADSRYHAAVLRLQVGDLQGGLALADTILAENPGHLFGYLIRGTAAQLRNDSRALAQAERDFLRHYPAESAAKRVEYLKHQPVIDDFLRKSQAAAGSPGTPP
jgi:hypothetical protein